MRRTLSSIVLIAIFIPIFIGILPRHARGQIQLPARCQELIDNGVIDQTNSLEQEITRNNNQAEFLGQQIQLLQEALVYLDQAEKLPQNISYGGAAGPGGGANPIDLNQPERNRLRSEAQRLAEEVNTNFQSNQIRLTISADINWWFDYERNLTPTELKLEIEQSLSRMSAAASEARQNSTLARICEEQLKPTPDQDRITDLENQVEQEREAQDINYEQEREAITAQSELFNAEIQNYSACGLWSGDGLKNCVRDLIGLIFDILTAVATYILQWAQVFFNYVIKVSIVDFKSLIDGGSDGNIRGNGLAVDILWRIFRDLGNLTLIFMLLYIAGATILQITSVNTRQAVTSIIVVALLINFSAVFTRIAIDASNVMALVFYDRFQQEGQTEPNIAGEFVKSARVGELLGTPAPNPPGSEPILGQVAKGIGTLILILVTAWVLIMSAGFFLVRTVALILLIISSPLAAVGYAIPAIKKQVTDKWLSELKKQLTFAPLYMMLLYMTITLARGAREVTFANEANAAIGHTIIYIILIMMMLMCLKIARDSAGGVASTQISTWGGLAAGYVGGIAGRNSVGRVADKLSKSSGVQSFTSRVPILGRTLQTGLTKAAEYGYGSKINYRQANEARVKIHTTAMANMDKTQKAAYIANLSTQQDQINAYNALSDKDKVAVELEISKPENSGLFGWNSATKALARARTGVNIENIKGTLRGEKQENLNKAIETEKAKEIRKKAYAPKLKEGTEDEWEKKTERQKYEELGDLLLKSSANEKEQETIYSGLTDLERAAVVVYANTTNQKKLEALARKLTGEKYEKYSEQLKKLGNSASKAQMFEDLDNLLEGTKELELENGETIETKTNKEIQSILKQLGPKGVANLGDDKLKNIKIVKNLTERDIAAIKKLFESNKNSDGSLISDEALDEIDKEHPELRSKPSPGKIFERGRKPKNTTPDESAAQSNTESPPETPTKQTPGTEYYQG